MLRTVNNDIYMTRGDTAELKLSITDSTGAPYMVKPEDSILFTIKKSTDDKDVIIQKAVKEGKITIKPEETRTLPYGTYVYDVELRRADDFISTVITPHIFKLCEEVTF